MEQTDSEMKEMMKDMIKINAVIATELIQLVENSSRQLRGEIPESCKVQHGALKKRLWKLPKNGIGVGYFGSTIWGMNNILCNIGRH